MCAAPLGCMASAITRPLNLPLFAGLRTMMRVLYGLPFAVPDMKYSRASYPYFARPLPVVSDGVESKMGPGPVTSAETEGIVTAVGLSGRFTGAPRCPRWAPAID